MGYPHLNVDEFVGIPFVMCGRERSGADCWGLLRLVYRRLGVDLPAHTEEYQTIADKEAIYGLLKNIKSKWREVDTKNGEKEQVTDAVLLNIAGLAFHVGVVVRPGFMLHTMVGKMGSEVEDYTSHTYKNRILGFYRHERFDHLALKG